MVVIQNIIFLIFILFKMFNYFIPFKIFSRCFYQSTRAPLTNFTHLQGEIPLLRAPIKRCLQGIIGYCWNDSVSHQQLLPETHSCTAHQWHLHLYGHMACYLKADYFHRAISVGDNPKWRRLRGCPQGLWHEEVNRPCHEIQ